MDLMKIAAQMFIKNMGSEGAGMDTSNVMGALKGLLPTQGDDLDIGNLVKQFTGSGGGLASMAASWLGNGSNDSFSIDQVLGLFGQNKVEEFSNKVGVSTQSAASGLSQMIPDLIDKSSEGGSLVDNVKSQLGSKLLKSFF